MIGASFTERLHHGVGDERGSLRTYSKAMVREGYVRRDPAIIVEFCRYVMGIYEFRRRTSLGSLGVHMMRLLFYMST